MKKLITIMLFVFVAVSGFSDALWKNTVKNFEENYINRPKIIYLKMSSITKKGASHNEITTRHKYENGKKYKQIIEIKKNGKVKPLSKKILSTWSLVKSKNKKKKKSEGLVELFRKKRQNSISYKKVGSPKNHRGYMCQKYNYKFPGKRKATFGFVYIDTETATPVEIIRKNNSKFMRKSKDSYIRFGRKGKKIFTSENYVHMNISFFGKSKKLIIYTKNKY